MINGRDKLEDEVESQFAAQSFAQADRQLKRGGGRAVVPDGELARWNR